MENTLKRDSTGDTEINSDIITVTACKRLMRLCLYPLCTESKEGWNTSSEVHRTGRRCRKAEMSMDSMMTEVCGQ
jgi:hypothetical protein